MTRWHEGSDSERPLPSAAFLLLRSRAVTLLIGKMELLWILLLLFRCGKTISDLANTSAHVALDGKDAMVQFMVHFLEI